MSAKNFVFNMGFDYSHITTILTLEGIDKKADIYLLTPKNIDRRQENSIRQLRSYLDDSSPNSVIKTVEMYSGFEENLLTISELLEDLEDTVLSFSGGPRDYLVPLIVGSSFKQDKINKIYLKSDLDNSIEELEVPYRQIETDNDEKQILELLEKQGDKNIKELSEELELSQSTASRKVEKMRQKGLVKTAREGKAKRVEPSLKARLVF